MCALGLRISTRRVPLDDIQIQYRDRLDNAIDYVVRHPTDYRDALDTEPVDVLLDRGVYWLEDGHHRYVTALLRGDRDILAALTIQDNPVVALMRRTHQENTCLDNRDVVQLYQEDPDGTQNQKSSRAGTAGSLRRADRERDRRNRRRTRRPRSGPPDERSGPRDGPAGRDVGSAGSVTYRVESDDRVERKDLKKIPRAIAVAVAAKLRGFITDPRPAGYEKVENHRYLYRIHIKNKYRIIYSIYDAELLVEVQHVRIKNKRTYDNLRDPPPPSQRESSYRGRDAGPQEVELERLFGQLLPGTRFANRVFAVGGYVRDQLQRREPADLDIAVELPYGAQRFAGFLLDTFPGALTDPKPLTYAFPIWSMRFIQDVEWAGEHYAVKGAELDLTDTQTVDRLGEEPTTRFGPVQQDVERRDFTVNMLYRDLTSGEILDPTGVGQSDIERGLLRARPDEDVARSFREQPRRMMRLIRFMVQYDWKLDPAVEAALLQSADVLETLSRRDLEKEFAKLQRRNVLDTALKLLRRYGLLDPLRRAWARERTAAYDRQYRPGPPKHRRRASTIAHWETITLSSIASEIMPELIAEAGPLSPSEYENEVDPIIVAKESWGYDIVDGFHRTAGLLAWAEENEKDAADIKLKVVVSTHPALTGLAAEPGPRQERAIRRIYRDVGLRHTAVYAAYDRQYQSGPLQHRRQTSQLPTGNVLLFSDDERRNHHYGPHVWTLVTELPEVPDHVVRFAQQYYDVDEEEARELVDPPDIVDSAGAWDNPEFVYEVWDRFEDPGYRTYDGAVLLDRDAVELQYRYDAENE